MKLSRRRTGFVLLCVGCLMAFLLVFRETTGDSEDRQTSSTVRASSVLPDVLRERRLVVPSPAAQPVPVPEPEAVEVEPPTWLIVPVDSESGLPVEAAQLRVNAWSFEAQQVARITHVETGGFRVRVPTDGSRVAVVVSAQDYVDARMDLPVGPAEVRVPLNRGGRIEVSVRDESGNPISGAHVRVGSRTAETDHRGLAGFATIAWNRPVAVSAHHGGVTARGREPVSVRPDRPDARADIVIRKLLSLRVTVHDKAGNSLRPAQVDVASRTFPLVQQTGRSDGKHPVVVEGLEPGIYWMKVSAAGHEPLWIDDVLVESDGGSITAVLSPREMHTVSGTVTDRQGRPVAGVQVQWWLKPGRVTYEVTDGDGRFGLPDVRLRSPRPDSLHWRVRRGGPMLVLSKSGWAEVAHPTALDSDRTYVIERVVRVRGRAVTADGPVKDWVIVAFSADDGRAFAPQRRQGMDGPGTFRLEMGKGASGYLALQTGGGLAVRRRFEAGETTKDIDVGDWMLERAGDVEVVVTSGAGEPIRSPAGLFLREASAAPDTPFRPLQMIRNGSAKLRKSTPAGEYVVWTDPAGFFPSEPTPLTVPADGARRTTLTVIRTATLRVRVTRRDALVVGIATTVTYDGPHGDLFYSRSSRPNERGGRDPVKMVGVHDDGVTDEAGEWVYRRLPPGNYVVTARSGLGTVAQATTTVEEGSDTDLTIDLDKDTESRE